MGVHPCLSRGAQDARCVATCHKLLICGHTIHSVFFVYMVRCADETLYTGIARDPEKRVQLHNKGKGAKYTRSRLPVTLTYIEPSSSLSEALKREHELKLWSRARKEALVAETSHRR